MNVIFAPKWCRSVLAALAMLACMGLFPARAAHVVPGFKPQTIFSLAAYPNALCDDGTPGVYYFRKSTTGSTRWIFYLEGGGNCTDVASCSKARSGNYYFTTSTGWNGKSAQGLLSQNPATNPTFYDANVVKVHYCSQDDWSGAKVPTAAFTPDDADTGWWFQGRAIAVAALQDLAARDSQTGLSAATDILFSGSSAGGLGIVFTVNDLLPYVPLGARALLAVDAGFTLEIGTFDKTAAPTYVTTYNPYDVDVSSGSALWNGHGDSVCASLAVTQTDLDACYDTTTVLDNNYVQIPTFIAESELDTDQLTRHRWKGTVNQDTPHMTYATEFADAMVARMQGGGLQNTAFAPQRLTHTLFVTDAQYTYPESFPAGTMTPASALSAWFLSAASYSPQYGNASGLP